MIRCSGSPENSAFATTLDLNFEKKEFWHNLICSDNYNRKGFGHKKETLELIIQEYTSNLIKTLKENNSEYTWAM